MTAARFQCAFNRTRESFLATELRIADTHWSRLLGLLGLSREKFPPGGGLWIVPCHGVHTLAMRFSIDIIYLDSEKIVIHTEENVKPWRIAPILLDAATVLELPAHVIWDTRTQVGDSIEILESAEQANGGDDERSHNFA
jgi:uncharacterized protein